MAGNFILKSIVHSDLILATNFPNISWSKTVAHKKGDPINPRDPEGKKFLGWVTETRTTLITALSGGKIDNREKLPPHRYLTIRAWPSLSDREKQYIQFAGWAESLLYPNTLGLGLKVLPAKARIEWSKGNRSEALIETLKKGGVSIEIYYQSKLEMV